jgi:quinoprotein relay system zinc metallohydrolase 2
MTIAIVGRGSIRRGDAFDRRMKRQLCAVICAALLASPAAADPALPVDEIAPGVFVHAGAIELMSAENRGDIANAGFVVGQEAVAVIDTGGSVATGEALLRAVRAETDLPVRYVINTHMHPDHVFGNAAFKALDPVFVGAARLPAALSARGAHYVEANTTLIGEDLAAEVDIIPPSLLVTDVMNLDLGGRRLSLRAWPAAHTDNDLTVLDEATRTLFAGDLVFLDHIPALDGSIRGWLSALDALAAIPAERAVPGHGPASAPWPDALAPGRRYLATVAAEVEALIEAGGTISEAPPKVARDERGKWQLFDEFHARNVIAAFAELEWE